MISALDIYVCCFVRSLKYVIIWEVLSNFNDVPNIQSICLMRRHAHCLSRSDVCHVPLSIK